MAARPLDSILAGLNDAQKAAVSSPASVLQVLAPPGSGKTKTLTARVAYLIASNGLNPSSIIVCTFTVKAAREMKERIERFLGFETAGKLILGTFHSICRRFLVSYGHLVGLSSRFSIADALDSRGIISQIIKKEKLSIDTARARGRISGLKANRISAREHAASSEASTKTFNEQQELARVYLEYEEQLTTSNILDYDDLLLRCADLLHRFPGCVSSVDAVLIDEFQDTNNVQYDLMRLFAQSRNVISIVGDPDQSIYGWRSAKVENLGKMTIHYPDTHVATLEESYRSSGCILFASQQVIEQDLGRPQKKLAPTHSAGVPPVLRRLHSAGAEAQWIVEEIERASALTGGLLNWNDFAILLRTASQSRQIETALAKAGIPHRVVGGHRYFDRFEVRLLLDYLRVLDHPDHTAALLHILNCPPRKIGDATLESLVNSASDKRLTLWDMVLKVARGTAKTSKDISNQAQKGIESFVNLVIVQRRKLSESESSLEDFVKGLVEKLQLQNYLKKQYPDKEDSDERWSNVQELIAQAAEAEISVEQEACAPSGALQIAQDSSKPDEIPCELVLAHFLGNVALSTSAEEQTKDNYNVGQVTLSTMHAAKGLEWPIVLIPSICQGSIPHSRAENADEERRLLYVAMTRAQGVLYLSCPSKDSMGNATALSSFLCPKEVKRHLLHRGPKFDHNTVHELAKILRRRCPTAQEIELGRSTIERLEDNRFIQVGDGKQDGENNGYQSQDLAEDEVNQVYSLQNPSKCRFNEDKGKSFSVKRRNVCTPAIQYQAATAMTKPTEYTISRTSLSNAFMSASKLPRADRGFKASFENSDLPSAGHNYPQKSSRAGTKSGAKDTIGHGTLEGFLIAADEPARRLTESANDLDSKERARGDLTTLENISNKAPEDHAGVSPAKLGNNSLGRNQGARLNEAFCSTSGMHRTTTKKTLGVRRDRVGWISRRNK